MRSGALDAADDGRGGVEDGVLSCPDVDPSRNQIHHTQCGAGALADDTFHRTYAERIGAEMASKLAFSAWLLACCSGSSHPPGRVWITVARQPPPPHLSIDHPPALDLALRQQQGAGAAGVEGNPRGEGVALPALALAAMRAFECRSVACLLRTICERAVRARAEDRNYGRTRAQAGARVGRLLLVRSGRSSSAHDVLVPGPKAQARDGTRHERSVPMHCKGESCGPLGRARGAP